MCSLLFLVFCKFTAHLVCVLLNGLRFDEMLQSYTLLGTHAVGSSIAYGLTVQVRNLFVLIKVMKRDFSTLKA